MAAVAQFVREDVLYKTEKPYTYIAPDVDTDKSNIFREEQPLIITDVLSLPESERPTMETHGLCYITHESQELPNVVDLASSQPYAMEMAELVKELLGAKKVIPFQTLMRSSDRDKQVGMHSRPGDMAHIDINTNTGWDAVMRFTETEDEELVRNGTYRARIINFWRPRLNDAEDIPLAVLDPGTLDESDIVVIDTVVSTAAVEAIWLKHNPNHRWYWLSNQTPGEAIIFIQYDTHPPKGVPNRVAHVAFRNEAARVDCPPRRSIELRLIVLEPAPYEKPAAVEATRPADLRKQPWREFVNLPPPPTKSKANFTRKNIGSRGHVSSADVD